MDRKYWRGRPLDLGPEDDGDPLGPDARDADLLDDSWEDAYLRGERRQTSRVMRAGLIALSLLALAGILVPMTVVVTR